MRLVQIIAVMTALGLAGPAQAGEQYVDETGYALSGHDVVAYYELEQAPIGARQPEPVPGRKDITADYNGATWAFASEANREKFLADPQKYVPAYDGHCAYGVAKGGKVPGNPDLWRIVDGTLYLNINDSVAGFWEEDIPGNIGRAESNWPRIEGNPAHDGPNRFYTPDAPIEG